MWQDAKNADLRQKRPDPNILLPGDVLYIPDASDRQPAPFSAPAGSTNSFTAPASTATVTVTLVVVPSTTSTTTTTGTTTYASRAYTIQELPDLTGLQTDGNGTATFDAPVTVGTATLVFTDTGEQVALTLGAIDPIDSLSGMFQRLQNLGYIGPQAYDNAQEQNNIYLIRAGLLALKGKIDDEGDGPPSAPDSGPVDSGSGSESGPESRPDPGADPDAGTAGAGNAGAGATPGSDPSVAASPPPSAPAPVGDNAGLSDDGTLDDDTRSLLLKAYGC